MIGCWPRNGYIGVYIYQLALVMPQGLYWITVCFIFVCQLVASWGHWASKCFYYCCLIYTCEQWLLQLPDSISISLCGPLLLACLQDCNHCLYRVDVCKSLLIGQFWHIHVYMSIRKCGFLVHPYFSSSAQYILFFLLGWFVARQVLFCGQTSAVLWAITSMIY